MIQVTGTARIKHTETGEVFEIDADSIVFELVSREERAMGPEVEYVAAFDHPDLGQLEWSLWEYPVGTENHRETDVGPHELLEDLSLELAVPPDNSASGNMFTAGNDDDDDDDDDDDEDDEDDKDDEDDEDRKARVDVLVKWFFEHFEDPANRLPHVSADGGYQWIWGGPCDAREELSDNFPDEDEDIIDAAVQVIEADGLYEWSPIPEPDDYAESDSEPVDEGLLGSIAQDLDALIQNIPEPSTDPAFEFGDDGLLHLATPPDSREIATDDILLDELRTATSDLRESLSGTNAHADLLRAVERYEAALTEGPFSISRLYARGVRLDNAAYAMQDGIDSDDLPPLSPTTDQHLRSVLELHRSYIMSRDDGRALAQGAEAYRRSPDEMARLARSVEQLAGAVDELPNLFSQEVREQLSSVAQDTGKGPNPDRSNQVAATTIGNMVSYLLKGVGIGSGFVITQIAGKAIVASDPGMAAIGIGTETINYVWTFLTENAQAIKELAALSFNDQSWLGSLSQILGSGPIKGIPKRDII